MSSDSKSQRALSKSSEIRFLLLWAIVPSVLRLATLWHVLPAGVPLGQAASAILSAAAAAVPQDLLVACQALFVAIVLRNVAVYLVAARWAELFACVAGTVLFALAHIYLLVDFLLYWHTGIRMDLSFLGFLPAAGEFVSSAEAMGLAPLFLGVALLAGFAVAAFRFFRRNIPALRLSPQLLLSAPILIALGMTSLALVPPELAYRVNNAVLNDQSTLLADVLRNGPALTSNRNGLDEPGIRPQAETYELVSSEYPLLKNTKGFTGEKQFDVSVGTLARPHVIFLQMESFRAADIGALGGKHGATPNFDRLAKEGVLFTNFYANGVQTTRGTLASLFGILPRFAPRAVQATNPDLPLIGLPDMLKRQGYRTGMFLSSELNWDNSEGFHPQHGFDELHGINELERRFPGAARTSWGIHDEYLMRYAVDWLEQQDRQGTPTFMDVQSVTNHHPWQVPPGYTPPKFNVPSGGEYPLFLQTFHYADYCIGLFVDELKRRGLDQKTILFIYADTSTPMGEHHNNYMLVNYLYEENLRIPLLILAPGRLQQPAVVHDIGSQVDLLPTVMDILGMSGVNHAIGTTLVRSVPDRVVYFNNPFALQYVGMRKGNFKYVFTVRSRRSAVYDLIDDPQERNNLAQKRPDLVALYHDGTMAVNLLMSRLFAGEKFAPATDQ